MYGLKKRYNRGHEIIEEDENSENPFIPPPLNAILVNKTSTEEISNYVNEFGKQIDTISSREETQSIPIETTQTGTNISIVTTGLTNFNQNNALENLSNIKISNKTITFFFSFFCKLFICLFFLVFVFFSNCPNLVKLFVNLRCHGDSKSRAMEL